MLTDRYDVRRTTWKECEGEATRQDVALVVLDVTHITGDRVLALVSRLLPEVRVLVMSLDRNQVDVYEIAQQGLVRQGELPSLLSLGV
jgi:hypothetical protein